MITQKYLDLTYKVIGCAIEVHKTMGRGLLESVYHLCLKEELNRQKINFKSEMKVPLIYKDKELEIDFRCDMLIENCLVVELKSVLQLNPIFEAQLQTYMNIFKEGQKTIVNNYFKQLPEK